MKRGATKEEIIRTTQELITRNGIRAVRVDEIAEALGISKRTLYEMFADKNDLVCECLADMSKRQQLRIVNYRKKRSVNPMHKTFLLVGEYIDNLFLVESSFLADVRRKMIFADEFALHREFWCNELSLILEECRQQEILLPEIEASAFAKRIMDTLLKLRLDHAPREELALFGRTLLRGCATNKGIEFIDRKKA